MVYIRKPIETSIGFLLGIFEWKRKYWHFLEQRIKFFFLTDPIYPVPRTGSFIQERIKQNLIKSDNKLNILEVNLSIFVLFNKSKNIWAPHWIRICNLALEGFYKTGCFPRQTYLNQSNRSTWALDVCCIGKRTLFCDGDKEQDCYFKERST